METIVFDKDSLFKVVCGEIAYKAEILPEGQRKAYLSFLMSYDEKDFFDRAVKKAANELAETVSILRSWEYFVEAEDATDPSFEQDEASITLRCIMLNNTPLPIVFDKMEEYLIAHVARQWFMTRGVAGLAELANLEMETAERNLLVAIQRKEIKVNYSHY